MADLNAAVETLARQKLHFEQETLALREMETKLRAELVERKIEIAGLHETLRQIRSLAEGITRRADAKRIYCLANGALKAKETK